jgi:hypothetical protein
MPPNRYRGPPMTLANMRERSRSCHGLLSPLEEWDLPHSAVALRAASRSQAADGESSKPVFEGIAPTWIT